MQEEQRQRFQRTRAMFATRTRKAAFVFGALVVGMTSAALAAWLITFSQPAHHAGGHLSTATTPTVTINSVAAEPTVTNQCTPGGTCDAAFNIIVSGSGTYYVTGITGSCSFVQPSTCAWGTDSATLTAYKSGGTTTDAPCSAELNHEPSSGGYIGLEPTGPITGLHIAVTAGAAQTVVVPGYWSLGNLPDTACSNDWFNVDDTLGSKLGTVQLSSQ